MGDCLNPNIEEGLGRGLKRGLMEEIGHRTWAIAEGYIPSRSVSQDRALVSH